MRRILLLLVGIYFISSINGQELEFNSTYATSSSKYYSSSGGFSIGYNQFIKARNRLGISVSTAFNGKAYDDIYHSTSDGVSVYIEQIDPNNYRIAFRVNYAFRLINNAKSRLYLGPEIGLNYFILKEQIDRIPNGSISEREYTTSENINHRLGIGFIFEFELKEIIHKRISTFLSINPEVTSFEKFGMMGGYDPYYITWLNFNLGIRYSLKNIE